MRVLNRYHKQGFPKDLKKELKEINKVYGLGYKSDLKSLFDLMVFKEGLKNKQMFEKTFERFRNKHLDMWDNLEFNERNMLLKYDLDPVRARMSSFEYSGSTIYIPFFDVLMNNLYERETAVLELPQFFKLYRDFKKSLIDMSLYGDLPLVNNMSELEFVGKDDTSIILYLERNRTLYELNSKGKVIVYPFNHSSSLTRKMLEDLAGLILSRDEEGLLNYAAFYKLLHPKLIKKYSRR